MRTRIEIVAGIVVVFLAVLFAVQWHQQEIRVAVAQSKSQGYEEAEAKLAGQVKDLDAHLSKIQEAGEQQQAAIQRMTIPQIVVKTPQYVPQATAPMKVLDANSAAVKGGEAKAGDVIVPQENVRPIAEKVADDQICNEKLRVCTQKTTAINDELVLATRNVQQWKDAAKGGTRKQRFMKSLKVIACATAGAAAGAVTKKPEGAAIGAAAGAGICSVF